MGFGTSASECILLLAHCGLVRHWNFDLRLLCLATTTGTIDNRRRSCANMPVQVWEDRKDARTGLCRLLISGVYSTSGFRYTRMPSRRESIHDLPSLWRKVSAYWSGAFSATAPFPRIAKIYPLDAMFDIPDDVPEDIKSNKRHWAAGCCSAPWFLRRYLLRQSGISGHCHHS